VALFFNGVNIPDGGTFNFNGVPLEQVSFNGVRVWTGVANIMVAGELVGPVTFTGFALSPSPFGTLTPGNFEGITINVLSDAFGFQIGFFFTLAGIHASNIFTSIRVQGPGVDETRNSAAANYTTPGGNSQWEWPGVPNLIGIVNGSTYSITIIP
jgi:hypothetical protein